MERSKGFSGSFRYMVDAKNRISIPAKLRREISLDTDKRFIILSDKDDKCIKLYPYKIFQNILDAINKTNPFDPVNAYVRRRFFSNIYDEEMDGQYRIKLPSELLKKVNIDGECLVVGVGDYIELWNPQEFEKYLEEFANQHPGDFGSLIATVMNGSK